MAQKNDTPVLILALLVTLALLGGGGWWLAKQLTIIPAGDPAETSTTTDQGELTEFETPKTLEERFSTGERLLVPALASPEKQAAAAAIAAGNISEAIANLEAALRNNRNDPEALIYLNNARITSQAHTIAVSVPLPTSSNPALEILRGVAQAQDEINSSGGINGISLRVMIVGDDNDPAICEQVAESLVQDPSVLGVVGHFGSEASLAAAPVYQDGGLVMVSPTSTSVELSEGGDYIFRTVPSDRFTASSLARYMVNTLRLQNAAIFFNAASNYSTSLKNEFTTAVYGEGGQVVAEFDIGDGGFNVDNALSQATQQGAEVLVMLSNTPVLDTALQVITRAPANLALLGGDSLYNPRLLEVAGEQAEGMVVAVPWHVLTNADAPFVAISRQLWGGDVNWRTAMTYDATLALVEGIRQDAGRPGIKAALSAPDFLVVGATGAVRFLPSGDRNQAMQLVLVQPGERSGYGYDFVPLP
jgi:branched-chain amino acid transport system substrate-binding protein